MRDATHKPALRMTHERWVGRAMNNCGGMDARGHWAYVRGERRRIQITHAPQKS